MHVFDTAIGRAGVEWDEAGITEVLMPGRSGLVDDGRELPPAVRAGVAGIVALLAGERRDLREIVLDDRALDDFRRRVYAATRAIGPGETATYGEIARAIGDPGAARAVGAPWAPTRSRSSSRATVCSPPTAPCTASRRPGGIATKRRMLEIEGAPGFTQESLFA